MDNDQPPMVFQFATQLTAVIQIHGCQVQTAPWHLGRHATKNEFSFIPPAGPVQVSVGNFGGQPLQVSSSCTKGAGWCPLRSAGAKALAPGFCLASLGSPQRSCGQGAHPSPRSQFAARMQSASFRLGDTGVDCGHWNTTCAMVRS